MLKECIANHIVTNIFGHVMSLQVVLFAFRPDLALRLQRSFSKRSPCYVISNDHCTRLTSSTLIRKPFMNYPG